MEDNLVNGGSGGSYRKVSGDDGSVLPTAPMTEPLRRRTVANPEDSSKKAAVSNGRTARPRVSAHRSGIRYAYT